MMIQSVPQEGVSERNVEQIEGSPVAAHGGDSVDALTSNSGAFRGNHRRPPRVMMETVVDMVQRQVPVQKVQTNAAPAVAVRR